MSSPALDPEAFRQAFVTWMQALVGSTKRKLVAIDGKTARRSFDRANDKSALHLVSAWVRDNQLVLGQIATEEKSNEITAIPTLLGMLDVRGATVTIDAMGAQKDIAKSHGLYARCLAQGRVLFRTFRLHLARISRFASDPREGRVLGEGE
jgi:hypothetical protein